jgi:hypothetical protein
MIRNDFLPEKLSSDEELEIVSKPTKAHGTKARHIQIWDGTDALSENSGEIFSTGLASTEKAPTANVAIPASIIKTITVRRAAASLLVFSVM